MEQSNNPNIFSKGCKSLSPVQDSIIADIKSKADDLWLAMSNPDISVDPRAMALAKTNLEQAVMWAVKAVT